jgi:hypothetical protein
MKKVILIVTYWLAAIFLTAILLTSLDYDLSQAVLMSLSFLPAAMALSFFLPKVEQEPNRRKRVSNTLCIVLAVTMMTFLLIYIWQTVFITLIYHYDYAHWSLPAMLGNPIFVAAVLAIMAYGHYKLTQWLNKRYPTNRPITFTSDYKKVSLKKEDILYIESRDSEVWIYARDGKCYRNKTSISQWENLLGVDFLRIHRSFLVNRAETLITSPDEVSIAGQTIPVSRKYKDDVRILLKSN